MSGLVYKTVQAYLQKASDLDDVRDISLTANCYEVHLDKIRDLCVGIPGGEYTSTTILTSC